MNRWMLNLTSSKSVVTTDFDRVLLMSLVLNWDWSERDWEAICYYLLIVLNALALNFSFFLLACLLGFGSFWPDIYSVVNTFLAWILTLTTFLIDFRGVVVERRHLSVWSDVVVDDYHRVLMTLNPCVFLKPIFELFIICFKIYELCGDVH